MSLTTSRSHLKIFLICFLSHLNIIPAHQPESDHVTTATTLILQLIGTNKDQEYISDAYFSMINYYRLNDDSINESNIFKEFSDIFNNNPSILNQYAWRMTELRENLNDALNKSNQAIALSDNNISLQAYIIDTKAEILWMLGRVDEAIIAIDLAIDINPNDEYLIEQRYKFLNSKNKGSINGN